MAKKTEKKMEKNMENKCKSKCGHGACGGAVYGLGFIGGAIYYIVNATSFWGGVWGVIKALVWPAFLIYNAFKALGV